MGSSCLASSDRIKRSSARTGSTKIRAGDVLIVYGPIQQLQELDLRRAAKLGIGVPSLSPAAHQQFVEPNLEPQSAAAV